MTTTNSATRAHLLVYDIPTGAKLRNVSQFLWRIGARINLSCWIVPDKNVPLVPIAEWRAAGAVVEIVRFDERDGDQIIRLATQGLLGELQEIRNRLDAGIASVRDRLGRASAADESELNKLGAYRSGCLRNAKRSLVAAQECAATFDIMGEAGVLLDGLRDCIKAHDEISYAWFKDRKAARKPAVQPLPQVAMPLAEPEPVPAPVVAPTPVHTTTPTRTGFRVGGGA